MYGHMKSKAEHTISLTLSYLILYFSIDEKVNFTNDHKLSHLLTCAYHQIDSVSPVLCILGFRDG